MSTAVETQQKKIGAIAYVCCSDQSNEFHDSRNTKLLSRHARKEKQTLRKWATRTESDSRDSACCIQWSTDEVHEGHQERQIIIPHSPRPLPSRLSSVEPPGHSPAFRRIKTPPGWSDMEAADLEQAVEGIAKIFRIKPPSFTELQVILDSSTYQGGSCALSRLQNNPCQT